MEDHGVGDKLINKLRADDLRYLVAVANTGRLVAAAGQLGVDHSTVSRRVRALEKTLGARLLEKGSDGFELTELGRTIAERAAPIEAALQGVARAARGATEDEVSGHFRLMAPDGFAAAFVAPALVKLRERHPGLIVELLSATRQLGLHQAGFDLAIAIGMPATTRLLTERLCDYRLALYASPQYLQTHGHPSSAEDLREHSIIFYVESMLQVGDLDIDQYVPGADTRLTSTNIFAQLEATVHGGGIGLLPRFMAQRTPDLVELVETGVDVHLPISLSVRRDGAGRPSVQEVRRALHDEVAVRRDELLGRD
ncbi:LysR family transcriptional regulator [Nocardioides sp. AX2bis]|uniref:LysR family transcriptional regulator n=1 Tax=Nocardioides sp. AX2bis TaxID=2653157 RepID=UPI0012F1207B|nr:LysR family transcriptional regulator [Nocardioides sp. AX2bis]VXC25915.1 DNA-binding transcriptional regulator, LysR family [Nocardioides sp. AX2bis]